MQEQILQAFQRSAFDQALSLAQQWVNEQPGQVEPLSWLAAAQRQANQVDAALSSLDQALLLAPEDAGLHLQRATLLLTSRQLEEADKALLRTTELDPNKFESYLLQAHLAIVYRDYEKAKSLSRTAARLVPDHPQLHAIDGMVALQEGKNEEALGLLNLAAKALPNDPRILYALGFAFIANGHLAFAEQSLRRVLGMQPDSQPLMSLIAELCLRQGNAGEAAELVERLLLMPNGATPGMLRLAAQIQLLLGQPRAAADHALAGLRAQPDDRRTLELALMSWERLGATDEARGVLDAFLADHAHVVTLWTARLAVEPIASDAAAAVIEGWVAAMPEHVPAWEAKMRLHDMRQETEQALAAARQIVGIEPGRMSGEERVVIGLIAEGKGDDAVGHIQAMIEKAQDEGPRRALGIWLASVYDVTGHPAEAAALWLEQRQAQADSRLPLPPQAKSPVSWPEVGTVPETTTARPLFVHGLPGSGVERVITALGAGSQVVRTDRFSMTPPSDAFQRMDTLAALAKDEMTADQLVQGWRDALPARGIADGNVIDWLVWWDNALLWALRPQLPEGRLMFVLRDPRDMLLDWLAFGGTVPLAMRSVGESTDWMVRSLEQMARVIEQSLYPAVIVRIDGAENHPEALAKLMADTFGMENFPVASALPPARLPAGHWRKYRDVLGAAFNNLTPIAVRLGYLEN